MSLDMEYDYSETTSLMENFSQKNINELKSWTESLDKQKCIPKDLTDKQLVLFYNACQQDLDRTKKCIENYYMSRKQAPEFFDNRIIHSDELKPSVEALEFSFLPNRSVEGYDIIYHKLYYTEPSKYHLDAGIKLLFMTIDACLYKRGPSPGYIFLFDMRGVRLGHLTRLSLGSLKKFFSYIQEAVPVQMKAIHVLNTEPVIDKIMALIKPFMNRSLYDMIKLHNKNEDLDLFYQRSIARSALPPDYGGELPDTQTLHKKCMSQLAALEKFFQMESIDNNQFEVKPTLKNKRKFSTPCPNAYLNPGLDLLANEDPICNNIMEIVEPNKKRKRTKSCDIAAFENSALDLGISKVAINEFLIRELENVKKTLKRFEGDNKTSIGTVPEEIDTCGPLYANSDVTSSNGQASMNLPQILIPTDHGLSSPCINLENITNNIGLDNVVDSGISVFNQQSVHMSDNKTNVSINNTNISLSFIDRLALDSPNTPNALYYDDDLNESNIMEIKTITIVAKKKSIPETNTNPFLNHSLDSVVHEKNIPGENPFVPTEEIKPIEPEYDEPIQSLNAGNLVPRRLFSNDTNSTVSTVNESSVSSTESHEYQNIDSTRSDSPIYENIPDLADVYNKQSKILGHDVSHFSAVDIMNLNKISQARLQDSKKFKSHFLKAGKFIKTLKKKFKTEKSEPNATLNPYEVPRKPKKTPVKDEGIENPALKLDVSDEIEFEELEEEHQYETIKTLRNTRNNMNITPLKERSNEPLDFHNKTNTPGKKVRFDSTLNQEKYITGNSFECESPGFDSKIENYHDELENCINERKFIQQNM